VETPLNDTIRDWLLNLATGKFVLVLVGLVVITIAAKLLRRSTRNRLFTHILEEIDRNADRVGIAAATLNIEKHAPIEVRLTRSALDSSADARP
jgi:ribosomal protein L28